MTADGDQVVRGDGATSGTACLNATPQTRIWSVRRARLLLGCSLVAALFAGVLLLPPIAQAVDSLIPLNGMWQMSTITPMVSLAAAFLMTFWAALLLSNRNFQAYNVSDQVAQLLDAAGDEVYVFDLESMRYLAVNDAACRNLNMQRDDFDAIGPLQVAPALGRHALEEYCQSARESGTVYRLDRLRHRRRDGTGYPVEMVISHIPSAGRNIFMAVANDITIRRAAEQQLEFVAHHDPLTELPNRALFMDRMRQAILTSDRSSGIFAVMFCDLDLFKRINDTLGHDVGDAVLKAVGERLSENLRASDTVARLAGDEFTLLACGLTDQDDAERLARKILRAFDAPFKIGKHDIQIGSSIGVTLYPIDNSDPLGLLQHADQAMYAVKRAGRGDFKIYEPELVEVAERRRKVETALGHAMALDELGLCFSPVVDVRDGSVPYYRANLHWELSDIGKIPSAEVFATAQQIGMLEDLELWMLRSACEAMDRWRKALNRATRKTEPRDAGKPSKPLPRVIVSLSTWQLRKRDFSENVDELLRRYGVPPDMLVIGLQEGGLLDALEGVTAGFEALRNAGVQFNVESFGSGYQRLGQMSRFPVQSFSLADSVLSGLPDESSVTAVRSLVAAACSLEAQVMAINVKSDGQRQALTALGCHLIGGLEAEMDQNSVLKVLRETWEAPKEMMVAS